MYVRVTRVCASTGTVEMIHIFGIHAQTHPALALNMQSVEVSNPCQTS